jgi:hypothetical protein
LEKYGEYRRGAKRNAVRKWLKIQEKHYYGLPPHPLQELETGEAGNILVNRNEPVGLDASLQHEFSDRGSTAVLGAQVDSTPPRDGLDLHGAFATSSNATI